MKNIVVSDLSGLFGKLKSNATKATKLPKEDKVVQVDKKEPMVKQTVKHIPEFNAPIYTCLNPVALLDRKCEGCQFEQVAKCSKNGYILSKRKRVCSSDEEEGSTERAESSRTEGNNRELGKKRDKRNKGKVRNNKR